MSFPAYVHTIVPNSSPRAWPVEAQRHVECGIVSASNAMNLIVGEPQFRKDDFVREAGRFYQPGLGGSPSPVTSWLIKRHGFGTHFGNLSYTDAEGVLRDLIDQGIPVIVELYANKIGPFTIYGLHSVVLVGYSDPYYDAQGQQCEEYYVVDSHWPTQGPFSLGSNDRDVNGDGIAEPFPGNRTFSRALFRQLFATKIYFPVFPSQAHHDAWYASTMHPRRRFPFVGAVMSRFITGSYDLCSPQTTHTVAGRRT